MDEFEIEVEKWLIENKDKWRDFGTLEFLVDENEVPESVVKYFKETNETRKELDKMFDSYNKIVD